MYQLLVIAISRLLLLPLEKQRCFLWEPSRRIARVTAGLVWVCGGVSNDEKRRVAEVLKEFEVVVISDVFGTTYLIGHKGHELAASLRPISR